METEVTLSELKNILTKEEFDALFEHGISPWVEYVVGDKVIMFNPEKSVYVVRGGRKKYTGGVSMDIFKYAKDIDEIAREWLETKAKIELMMKELDELKAKKKDLEAEIVSESEKIKSNLIETDTYVIKVSKWVQAKGISYKEAFEYLMSKVNSTLRQMAEEFVNKMKQEDVRVKIDVLEKEGGIVDTIKSWWEGFKDWIVGHLKNFVSIFTEYKDELAELAELAEREARTKIGVDSELRRLVDSAIFEVGKYKDFILDDFNKVKEYVRDIGVNLDLRYDALVKVFQLVKEKADEEGNKEVSQMIDKILEFAPFKSLAILLPSVLDDIETSIGREKERITEILGDVGVALKQVKERVKV